MEHLTQLETVAAQLVGRIHDEDPPLVWAWLAAELPEPADWYRLCHVLACAVPTDRTWRELTEWARDPEDIALQQAMRRQALVNATKHREAA